MGKCDRCDIDIESDDKLCPYCEEQQGGVHPILFIIILFLIIASLVGLLFQVAGPSLVP